MVGERRSISHDWLDKCKYKTSFRSSMDVSVTVTYAIRSKNLHRSSQRPRNAKTTKVRAFSACRPGPSAPTDGVTDLQACLDQESSLGSGMIGLWTTTSSINPKLIASSAEKKVSRSKVSPRSVPTQFKYPVYGGTKSIPGTCFQENNLHYATCAHEGNCIPCSHPNHTSEDAHPCQAVIFPQAMHGRPFTSKWQASS